MKDHLQIHPEGIMLQVIQVQSHLVGPDNLVVILDWVVDLRQQFLLVAVFQRGGTRDAWTEFQLYAFYSLIFITLAGTPTAVQSAGKLLATTAPAPMMVFCPISI